MHWLVLQQYLTLRQVALTSRLPWQTSLFAQQPVQSRSRGAYVCRHQQVLVNDAPCMSVSLPAFVSNSEISPILILFHSHAVYISSFFDVWGQTQQRTSTSRLALLHTSMLCISMLCIWAGWLGVTRSVCQQLGLAVFIFLYQMLDNKMKLLFWTLYLACLFLNLPDLPVSLGKWCFQRCHRCQTLIKSALSC